MPAARDLTGLKGVRVQILNVPLTDPNTLYIGLNDRDKAWHDLYKLSLATGEKTLVRQNNDRIGSWVFDWNDQLRLAARSNPDGSTEWLRVEGAQLTPFYKTTIDEQSNVEGFAKDNQRVYLATNRGGARDLAEIVLLDPATGQEQPYQADPLKRVDVGELMLSEKTHEPVYVGFEDDRLRRVWKDKAFEQDFANVSRSCRGWTCARYRTPPTSGYGCSRPARPPSPAWPTSSTAKPSSSPSSTKHGPSCTPPTWPT
ncbi:hypothetical protein [Hymenobacter coccineus]|uniref:Dipeptidylpeptidase IV N-terminal domain-containing protein n=1 Tax=Hymenobacter coccineus TaxID=1908235 RepID=A0A1G1TK59_9BACT|nr:hypothetical protein [Hymenobacter coccineus]OGX91238.1 hypothetical protein BEN49_05365 [Hymenobacter coccineus]